MPKKMVIEISEHEGVYYATCPEMPGFLLCSTDKLKLEADIFPAMKQLLAIKEKHQNVVSMNRARLVEHRELAFQ